eukprot:388648_1
MTAEHKLQELMIRYESLAQERDVLLIQKEEYKKDIDEVKDKNDQLIEENRSYKELFEIEQRKITFTHMISSNMEDLNVCNQDLTTELIEYKKLIKQLTSENTVLKNENHKYKLALQNSNELTRKQQQMHMNNSLDLGNKITKLNNECELLKSTITSINSFQNQNQYEIIEKQSCAHSAPETAATSPICSTRLEQPKALPFHVRSPIKYMFDHSENVKSESLCLEEDSVNFGSSIVLFDKCTDSDIHSKNDVNNDDPFIKQSMTHEYETDLLTAKIDEIHKLQEINIDNEELIEKLEEEIKILTKRNHELRSTLDGGFRCVSLKWFS